MMVLGDSTGAKNEDEETCGRGAAGSETRAEQGAPLNMVGLSDGMSKWLGALL